MPAETNPTGAGSGTNRALWRLGALVRTLEAEATLNALVRAGRGPTMTTARTHRHEQF
jgi:hypothetical protein